MKRATTRRRGRKAVAAVAALAVTVASLTFLWRTFDGGGQPAATSSMPEAAEALGLDPDQICDVPTYDPDIAVLAGGNEVNEYPREVLAQEGAPASTIDGPATDALRRSLASRSARLAPEDGWRAFASTQDAVTFGAPDTRRGSWWLMGFRRKDAGWKQVRFEIADQHLTPAQRGHGLRLEWGGEVTLEGGKWNAPLGVRSDAPVPEQAGGSESDFLQAWPVSWADGYTGEDWAIPHIFDPITGREVGNGSDIHPSGSRWILDIMPGDMPGVELALGGSGTSLDPGSYIIVACISRLGLASPPGTLHVVDGPAAAEGHVLTYTSTGFGMQALGGGVFTLHNGCLAVGNGPDGGEPFTYVLWPHGYALVERGGDTVLIDPVGRKIGALGDKVRFGGGSVSLEPESQWFGDVPEACVTHDVEAYFVASGELARDNDP